MTPGERWRWAVAQERSALRDLWAAREALAEAEMERHYASFIHTAAAEVCPTCQAPVGAYCAIWENPDGSHRDHPLPPEEWRGGRLIALFLHPARSTTPAALAAAP